MPDRQHHDAAQAAAAPEATGPNGSDGASGFWAKATRLATRLVRPFSFGSSQAVPSVSDASTVPSFGSGYAAPVGGVSQRVVHGAPAGRRVTEVAAADVWKNSSVFTALNWIRRNFPDARIGVMNLETKALDLTHPMARLLRRPNPNYSYSTFWAGMTLSYCLGDAYALKVRNGYRQPIQLWYRPHWMLKPVRFNNSDNYLDGYWYKPDARTPGVLLPVSEVIHLRNGIDPENELCGMSDLKRLLRTVFTDNECDRFLAGMFVNHGHIGAVITHKAPIIDEESNETGTQLTPEQREQLAALYREKFTGDGVGGALVLEGEYNVQFPNVHVDSDFVEKAKDISQADIAAAIGIPPVVLNWHVGLKTSTAKASHEDARKQAYRECLIPMHRSMAEDLDTQLLPDFEGGNADRFCTAFDYSGVATLADDANKAAERWVSLTGSGIATRGEARAAVGLKTGPEDNIYIAAKKPESDTKPTSGDKNGANGGKNAGGKDE